MKPSNEKVKGELKKDYQDLTNKWGFMKNDAKSKALKKKQDSNSNECPGCGKKQKSKGRCASCMVNE